MSRKKSEYYIDRSKYDEQARKLERTSNKDTSREAIAKYCDRTKRQLEKYLSRSKQSSVPEDVLRKIAIYLECTPGWLCSADGIDAADPGKVLDAADAIKDSRIPPLIDYLNKAGMFQSKLAGSPEYLLAALNKTDAAMFAATYAPDTPESDFFDVSLEYMQYGDLIKGSESVSMDKEMFSRYITEIEVAIRFVTDRFIYNAKKRITDGGPDPEQAGPRI